MSRLTVQLLGPFEVRLDDVPVTDFAYDKVRALLAYLVTEAGRPQRRERLIALLWPDYPERSARQNLSQALYTLRAAIGDAIDPGEEPRFILATRQTVVFAPTEDAWSDVAAFDAAIRAARSHAHVDLTACAPCLARLTEAVALYRGDFLQDLALDDSAAFEEWSLAQREALHRQVLWALEQLADHAEVWSDTDLALAYARRQIALEPWCEGAHRQVMRALALSGQRAAALSQYESCARILNEELGIEPDTATKALYGEILEGALSPPMSPTVSATPLVANAAATGGEAPQPGLGASAGTEPSEREALEQRQFVSHVIVSVVGTEGLLARADVEIWSEVIEGVLAAVADEVARLGGIVDQRSAEGIVAAFGATTAREDDALRAVKAALAVRDTFDRYMRDLGGIGPSVTENGLSVIVGVATGEGVVSAGDTRTPVRTQALAIGHRVQQHAGPGVVWVDEATHRLTRNAFIWTSLKPIRLPGGEERALFSPLGERAAGAQSDGLKPQVSPLVGRQTELDALTEALARVQFGIGGIVTVVGEAGIGKSRLVAEGRRALQKEASATPGWVEGRCLSYATGAAYQVWQDLLGNLLTLPADCARAESCEALEESLHRLCGDDAERIYPYLARLLSLPLSERAAAEVDGLVATGFLQRATFQAVERLLSSAAARRPLVLVLEDLHWADASSLALLKHVMALTDLAPLLLVCLFRPETTHGCWSVREVSMREYPHRHTDLQLRPLSPDDSRSLVESLLETSGVTVGTPASDFVGMVIDRAEGNPFFAEEILQSWEECRAPADAAPAIPDTVRAVLTARIDRLPLRAQQMVQLAAVIGRIFGYRVLADLAEAAGTGQAEVMLPLDETLAVLQRHQLVQEQPRTAQPPSGQVAQQPADRTYIFRHQLTLEAAYATVPHRKRRALHRRVAAALERLYPEQVEGRLGLLAHHWEAAGDREQAIAYLRRAGEQAASQYANSEATSYFTRALALVPDEDREARYELLMNRERTHHLTGDRQAQTRDLDSLEALAQHLNDARRQAEVAVRRAEQAVLTNQVDLARQAAQRSLQLAHGLGDVALEALSYLRIAQAWGDPGATPDQALADLRQALELVQSTDRHRLEAEILHTMGVSLSRERRLAGLDLLHRALGLYRDVNDRAGEGSVLGALANIYGFFGDYTEARAIGLEAVRILRSIGSRREFGYRCYLLGYHTSCLGLYSEALSYLQTARQLCRDVGDSAFEAASITCMAVIFDFLGDYDKALLSFQEALSFPTERRGMVFRAWGFTQAGLASLHQGDAERGRAYVQRTHAFLEGTGDHAAHGWLPWNRAVAHMVMGHALAELGDEEGAVRAYHDALSVKRKAGPPGTPSEIRAGLARLHLRRGDVPAALIEVERVLSHLETGHLQGTLEPLRVYLTCYRVLDAAGDPRQTKVLTEAYVHLQEWSATIDDERLRRSYLENVAVNRELLAAWEAMP